MLRRLVDPARDVARAAGRPATYRGLLRETTSTAVTVAMWPFGLADRRVAELRRMTSPVDCEVPTPVLLVHGYGANKSNWLFLERYLRGAGFGRIHALNYNPLAADVPALAAACTERARRVMRLSGADRVHLIGHSLGGVVARYAVQVTGLEGASVCVSVASPHRGAPAARFGLGSTARQLRPGSAVLRRLSASSRRLPTRFVAYYSNLDLVVPARSAMILEPALRAVNICVKDEGHLSILLSRRLAASIVDQLAAAEGLPGHGSPVAALVSGGDADEPPAATGAPLDQAAQG